jgi:hypothetical protein
VNEEGRFVARAYLFANPPLSLSRDLPVQAAATADAMVFPCNQLAKEVTVPI